MSFHPIYLYCDRPPHVRFDRILSTRPAKFSQRNLLIWNCLLNITKGPAMRRRNSRTSLCSPLPQSERDSREMLRLARVLCDCQTNVSFLFSDNYGKTRTRRMESPWNGNAGKRKPRELEFLFYWLFFRFRVLARARYGCFKSQEYAAKNNPRSD
jgi:hypothetical protein